MAEAHFLRVNPQSEPHSAAGKPSESKVPGYVFWTLGVAPVPWVCAAANVGI